MGWLSEIFKKEKGLLEIAVENNFSEEKEGILRLEKDYILELEDKTMVYLANFKKDEFDEAYPLLQEKHCRNFGKTFEQAFVYPGTVLTGGALGIYLIHRGVNPLILLATVGIPAVGGLVRIYKTSQAENKKLEELEKKLEPFSERIIYNYQQIKGLIKNKKL